MKNSCKACVIKPLHSLKFVLNLTIHHEKEIHKYKQDTGTYLHTYIHNFISIQIFFRVAKKYASISECNLK